MDLVAAIRPTSGRWVAMLALCAAGALAIGLTFFFSQTPSGRITVQGHKLWVTNCASAWQSLSGSKPLNGDAASVDGTGPAQIDDATMLQDLDDACSTAIAGRDHLTVGLLALSIGFGAGALLVHLRRRGRGFNR
jgi:hypothetical protein